jgi:hypothetical protein
MTHLRKIEAILGIFLRKELMLGKTFRTSLEMILMLNSLSKQLILTRET